MSVSTNHTVTKRLFSHKPFRNALIALAGSCLLLCVLIVYVESFSPQPRIKTVSDGLYFVITTVTGVGYGDMVPVTTLGKAITNVVQVFGVVMFGLIIGIVGITLNKRQEEYYWFRLFDRLGAIEQRLDKIDKQTQFLVKGASPNPEEEKSADLPL